MKITHVFILCLGLFSCTQTPQQKAEEGIRVYVHDNFHNPDTYEPVKFGRLDSAYESALTSSGYLSLQAEIDSLHSYQKSLDPKIDETESILELEQIKSEILKTSNQMEVRQAKQDSIIVNYKGKFSGYTMLHELRAANATGALNIQTYRFDFDTNFVVVTAAQKEGN